MTVMAPWKMASTLILASSAPRNIFNYQLLLLQRTSRSSFFPNASVFPGGNLDASDYSYECWGPVLNEMKFNSNALTGRMRLPLYKEFEKLHFKNKTAHLPGFFNAEVVFRLCALRETFEETGILLAQDANGNRVCLSSQQLTTSDHSDWQHRVKTHPHTFPDLFTALKLTPDVFSLHEWTGWLTPANFPANKRYDTVFYLSVLPADMKLSVSRDAAESDKAKWRTPIDWLEVHLNSAGLLAPPQVYELGRLCQFVDWKMLASYAQERANLGSERWSPVIYYADEEVTRVMVYPGDQRYPIAAPESLQPIKMNGEELNSWIENDSRKNRLLKRGKDWYDNQAPFYFDVSVDRLGHVSPITITELTKLRHQHS